MTNSRQKGKRGELEWVHKLKEFGIEAHRSQQFKGSKDSADVISPGIPIHWEVKRKQALNPFRALEKAQEDAMHFSDGNEFEMPVVAWRKDKEKWIVCLYADDFLRGITGD